MGAPGGRSPGGIELSGQKKLKFYAGVVRPRGKVITLQVDWFNQENTARFYRKLRAKLGGWRIDVVQDQARWHRGREVRQTVKQTQIHEHVLPSYSPELNAAEPFIRWVKELLDVNTCWR